MANGSWQLNGNAGTDPTSDFVGTTDGNPLVVKATGITLDLEPNGGGQLHLTNNPGDNRVWLEPFNSAGNGSATELLLTGEDGENVPVMSLFADSLGVRSKEIILGPQSAGGGRLRIACNPGDNKVWLEAFDSNADGSAVGFLLTGALGSNVPQLSFLANNAAFSNNLAVAGTLSGPTIASMQQEIANLASALNSLAATVQQLELQS